jgi:hypothetical protein
VFFDAWLGKGLLTGGGHHWKRQRRLITPARECRRARRGGAGALTPEAGAGRRSTLAR